ncbi:DUF4062 domain-containing protein [Microbacterium sp. zg.B48]|uniref:DUF4062 domain-containing protein n=1 Tax=Microbacterium sp. zg.B48 TaxID=2969408 RepID=UPI00214C16B9|nr:DUF4062 domain-containing protein [Microbacterium sp. zg.B48]MCR2764983.1 DUF4062 domain-containing protein [Microbacterium sp. zg.B48]
MSRSPGVIRTPDQKLRVFVSSSLRELLPERRALRTAIETLAMAPVMFELGARPHPPRSLYRAYLEQSDIFVGVYWNSYGWIAPGENISGLEDEYNLAPDVPKLIYLKRSENREERLDQLLDRIRDDDTVSYVAFDDESELRALVTSDLATLLAEHFDDARHERLAADDAAEVGAPPRAAPPIPLNRLIGRDDELRHCSELLTTQGRRVVTLVGPGGIGKTRLALSVAQEVGDAFPDGVYFVDLAPVRDPSAVIPTIATAMGVRDLGQVPLRERVAQALDQRRILLVLDNVEQVVEAVPELRTLLEHTTVALLVTSRVLLRVDGEQAVTVPPMSVEAAVDLFAERARAVKPDFTLTPANRPDVAAVVSALDCLPLAVELAAARVRVLPPAAMARRAHNALSLLVSGARDRPDRQQTMRATIKWSADILPPAERQLLLRLGVFRGSFALDAVEWMCVDADATTALDLLDSLIDSSLIHEREAAAVHSYTMLATVREWAREELDSEGELGSAEAQHAQFYRDLAVRAEPELVSFRQVEWIGRLNDEYEDLRASVEYLLRTEQGDAVAEIVWSLYWFWWVSGRVIEIGIWMNTVYQAGYKVSERTRHRAEFYRTVGGLWVSPGAAIVSELEALLEYFVADGDTFGEIFIRMSTAILLLQQNPPRLSDADAHLERSQQIAEERRSPFLVSTALLIRGQVAGARNDVQAATDLFEASLRTARSSGDVFSETAAVHGLAWTRLGAGDLPAARELFVNVVRTSHAMHHDEGLALALEGMFAVTALAGDFEQAGIYLGAAEDARARRGIVGPTLLSTHQRVLAEVEGSPDAERFQAARAAGRSADLREVVAGILAS